MITDKQDNNNIQKEKRKAKDWLAPYQFKKGQSGNPEGRPVGKSMKEYSKEMLTSMDEKQRQDFLKGLGKDFIWQMAEGRPSGKDEVELSGKLEVDIETKAKINKAIEEII